MRPLWWEFPSDPRLLEINDAYMLGTRLLIAPVVTQGAKTRKVVFPAGATWTSFWDASVSHAGGTVATVDAPLGTPAVFWRA